MDFDYIIVGGGTAGSVLASRLSANPGNSVLVIEAGEDTAPGRVPSEILDSFAGLAYLNDRFLWNDLRVTTEQRSHNRPEIVPRQRKYEQARVLGGGSSINGQFANRGAPDDYDEWQTLGAKGWTWTSVLPYFRKLERDYDFEGPLHGKDGPIAISRIFPDLWPEHAKAMARSLEAAGYPYLPDQNGEFVDGYYPVAISNVYDRRVSASIGYLTPTVRARPNLRILTRTEVSGLVMEGRRCIGVRAVAGGAETTYRAREVIVSSGAIYSPAHLLRAGIGPAAELRAQGIEVLHDLPGVGKRLMDHPAVAIAAFIKPEARINGLTRRHLMLGVRMSSGLEGVPRGDMAVSISTKSAWHKVGDQLGTANIWVNRTYSDRGEVKLKSTNWRDQPQVDFNLLADERDIVRLAAAFRQMAAIILSPLVAHAISDPFPASYSDKVRQVAAITPKNRLLTSILARLLDGPPALRSFLMKTLILEGAPLEVLLSNEAELEAFVRRAAVGVWHASCSCRMGADTDPMAVVGSDTRVRGVDGLRVVDASIFPTIPRSNTSIPVIMVAERVADLILAEDAARRAA
ncbi:5-(hydroxymethyl)furfural/furfural oxidase [Devosia enhydra]|uniref:5-(Hydroxymethyl)furfural/furfural oxidase n=1 Tax=Devosia enhydra TaxID=665118 RepID=A0A1K2HSC7_9HYPH|nr:GMC family oxidoreductase N-terminal domain-containing protein [Devosia enhydra]SFZ80710.1 5-(hydroxymethyl)furfural/furfural oxidase [Devosia enhydra]